MKQIDFIEAVNLLKKYNLDFVDFHIINSLKDFDKLRYPIVLKIFSKKILHKTDVGGVITNIRDKEKAKMCFNKLKRIRDVEGIVAQKQEEGVEVIIGMKRDEQFGPVVMFGLGGIFIEVLRDVSFRICPLTKKDAFEMIKEIKGYKILKGIRGKKGVDIDKIVDLILKLSKLALNEKEIKEIDLNPVIVNEKRAVIVDVRMLK